MNKFFKIAGGVVLIVVGLVAISQFAPERLTAERLEQAKEVQKKLDGDKPAAAPTAEPKETPVSDQPQAPENNVFKVKFETTAGDFTVEVHRDWAPLGAARFEELVKAGYYDNCRFFRVVPGFVVQFGINGDPAVASEWEKKRFKDDPVKQSNTLGTMTFATAGPNTRTTQLFINIGNNTPLDRMGFSPFAKVTDGMENVQKIFSGYGERPDQGMITHQGNAYLEQAFPKLDYIKSAKIVQ